jgi:hypothetical protein
MAGGIRHPRREIADTVFVPMSVGECFFPGSGFVAVPAGGRRSVAAGEDVMDENLISKAFVCWVSLARREIVFVKMDGDK